MAQGQRSGIDSGMFPRRYQISDLAPYRKGDFLTIQGHESRSEVDEVMTFVHVAPTPHESHPAVVPSATVSPAAEPPSAVSPAAAAAVHHSPAPAASTAHHLLLLTAALVALGPPLEVDVAAPVARPVAAQGVQAQVVRSNSE